MKPYIFPDFDMIPARLPDKDHPSMQLVVHQIIEHAKAGQQAFCLGKHREAKYHRNIISEQLLWRLSVDGLSHKGEINTNSAKYETNIPMRHCSKAAYILRESIPKKKGRALSKYLKCDHIVPRSCVATVLVQPGWWHITDEQIASDFIWAHSNVAILTMWEDTALNNAGLKSNMPDEWWQQPLHKKSDFYLARYEKIGFPIVQVL